MGYRSGFPEKMEEQLYPTLVNGEPSPINYLERFNNAEAYFETIKDNMLGRAILSATTINEVNPVPYSIEVTKNQYKGDVSYNFEYNNLPAPLVSGALSEIINFSFGDPISVRPILLVLGKQNGPALQDILTKTESSFTVSVEYVLPTNFDTNNALVARNASFPPVLDLSIYQPEFTEWITVVDSGGNFSPSSGRGTKTVTWKYV
jgi:hypothetical protein